MPSAVANPGSKAAIRSMYASDSWKTGDDMALTLSGQICEAQRVDSPQPRKRALITGASSGIGEEFALHYAELGYDVVLAARNEPELKRVATACRLLGIEAQTMVVDLSASSGVDRLGSACSDVDILVANAGVTHAAIIGKSNLDRLDELTYLMATGVVRLCELVVPRMLQRGSGDVVIVSSIAAFTPMRKSGPYAASKSYATAYARSLALEVADRGVRVVVVCPGYVRTKLHQRAGLDHLPQRVPRWMWTSTHEVVRSAQRALARGKTVVIPGRIYRLTAPFLSSSLAQGVWRRLTRRA